MLELVPGVAQDALMQREPYRPALMTRTTDHEIEQLCPPGGRRGRTSRDEAGRVSELRRAND